MEKIIEFKNVSKTYDSGTHALNNASISIDKGEFVFIVGASGAGKSTFLKLIMHEETPSHGTILVNGINVSKLKRRKVPYLRRNMGIVFQDFRLIEKMTVYDNVAFAMRAIGANPSWLVAANTCGAGIGKMVSPQGIAIGAAAAGLTGSESKILSNVIKYCVIMVIVAGLLCYFMQ